MELEEGDEKTPPRGTQSVGWVEKQPREVEKSREATLGFEMIINNLFSFILTIKSVPFFATVMCLKLFEN